MTMAPQFTILLCCNERSYIMLTRVYFVEDMTDEKSSTAAVAVPTTQLDQSRVQQSTRDEENNKITNPEPTTHTTLTAAQPAHTSLYSTHPQQQPAHSQPPQPDPSQVYMRPDLNQTLSGHEVENFFSNLGDPRTGQPVVTNAPSGLMGYDEASLASLSNAQAGYAKAGSHYPAAATADIYKNSNMFSSSATPGLLSSHYSVSNR